MTVPVLPLIVLALLIVVVGVGIVLYLRKKSGAASKQEPVSHGLPVDLVTPYRAVKKDTGPALRFGPAVIALGDAGWKASRVLERFAGGSPATPAGDGSQLRIYRGQDVVVLELSDALVKNDAEVVISALSRLGDELPSGVVLVCLAVDYRSLATGAANQLASWAQVLQKRLPLLAKPGRSLGVRICVTGLESEPGYASLRALWLHRRASALSFLEIEHKPELQRFLGQVSAQLGVVLSARPGELESVTRLALGLPDALHALNELTVPLNDVLARYTQAELNGVHLTDSSGAAIPQRPFGFRLLDVARSQEQQERRVFVRQTLGAAGACAAMVLALVAGGTWVSRVGETVQLYAESQGAVAGTNAERQAQATTSAIAPTSAAIDAPAASANGGAAPTTASGTPATASAPSASASGAPLGDSKVSLASAAPAVPTWQLNSWVPMETAQRGMQAADSLGPLRFWPLPYAFSPQRREHESAFVDATRTFYVKPALEPTRSLSRRVFAACLGRATAGNDFGELVLANRASFEEILGIPPQTLTVLVRLAKPATVPTELPSLTQAAGSLAAWRGLVTSIASATEEGIFEPERLEELRAEAFLAELPKDAATVRVLQRAVSLLAAHADGGRQDEVRAAQQIHAELDFLVENLSSLTVLRDWFQNTSALSELREPRSLAQLLEVTLLRPASAKPAAAAGPTKITISLTPAVTIEQAQFDTAVARTRASVQITRFITARRQGAYQAPFQSACGASRSVDGNGSSFFPVVAPSWGESKDAALTLDALDALSVRGPTSRGHGPTATLPGWYTRAAVQRFVLPVVIATTSEVDVSTLTSDDLFTLRNFIDEELSAYADNYGSELNCYFQSFRFQPASLPLAESAVRELAAEGSWFERFLTVVAEQAQLPAEALTNTALAGAVSGFGPLSTAVAGKAIKDYSALLLTALPGAAAPAPAAAPTKADKATTKIALVRDERLTDAMAALASTNSQGAAAKGVQDWLDAQNIAGSYQRPFLLPIDSLRSAATYEIRQRWQRELVTPATNLLRKYPFRSDASALGSPATVPELEAEFGIDGRFWAVVLDSFSALVEAGPGLDTGARNQWSMRSGLSAPAGMLELLNAAERLTTALWEPDGKRSKLEIRLTPYELPVSRRGEPLIALAYLTVPGADVESFNQALEARTLAVDWWSADDSTLSVELLDRYASEVEAFSTVVQKQGAWSFLRLIDAGHLEDGVLTFYLHGEARKDSRVQFELHSDVRSLFTEVAVAADGARESKP